MRIVLRNGLNKLLQHLKKRRFRLILNIRYLPPNCSTRPTYNMNHRFLRSFSAVLLIVFGCLLLTGCLGRDRRDSGSSTAGSGTTQAGKKRVKPKGRNEKEEETDAVEADGGESAQPREIDPLDWTFWRGPRYNGVSPETGLIDSFNPDGGDKSNVAWKREDLGGRATPVTMNGKLYTIIRNKPETAEEGERLVCIDAKTGEDIWENTWNVWLSDVPDTRVGWSCPVADPASGLVFAHGVCGLLSAVDGETGETKWSVPLHERFGLLSTYGGRTNNPVVFEDLVITSGVVIGWGESAKPSHQFIAFDKNTGDVVWVRSTRFLPYDTTYSSPTVTVVDGQAMLVFGSGDGAVWALQPRTGKPIWNYRFSLRGLNVSPLVVGNKVFSGHSEENILSGGTANTMGSVVAIDATKTGDVTESGEIWRIPEFMAGKSSPVEYQDRLYVIDDRAKMWVLNTKDGEAIVEREKLGTVMRSSPLIADGKVYTFTQNGRWQIFKITEEGVETIEKGRLPSGESVDGSPIVSHGRMYLQTSGGIYCLVDESKKPGVEELPELPQETDVADDETVAQVQMVPADLLAIPGRFRTFKLRTFNANGQLLEERPEAAEYSLKPIEGKEGDEDDYEGLLGDDGTFVAPDGPAAVEVIGKVGDVTGSARVRVVPNLPWEYDFEGLDQPPITWVGARYRHVMREEDGNKVMVKITTIPKGKRSRSWMGHSSISNYTIQADVKGSTGNGRQPDIGLIAQGYVLDLQGVANAVLEDASTGEEESSTGGGGKQLQIRSWVPQLRMAKSIPFDWEADKWYTMKFQAAVEDGKAVLKGKVWPRDEDEPDAWTLEATDSSPVSQGSPGLFGNAKDAEIFLDNIKVYENPKEES